VENNNMGKLWKNYEKISVEKNVERIAWEKCGKAMKIIVWKR
jgi:hypothetical protein